MEQDYDSQVDKRLADRTPLVLRPSELLCSLGLLLNLLLQQVPSLDEQLLSLFL